MANGINGSNYMALNAGANGCTGYPFTLAVWARRTATITDSVIAAFTSGASTDGAFLAYEADGTVKATSNDFGVSAPGSNVSSNDTNWHLIIGIFSAANSRTVYCDGTAGTTNTTSVTFSPFPDRMAIGCYAQAQFVGTSDVAAAALWNVALTADDRASLQKFGPKRVRPESLCLFVPCVREEKELLLRPGFAATTGLFVAHPPILSAL
jgi:Concanavalin A-like lectin/glucanases superfamily